MQLGRNFIPCVNLNDNRRIYKASHRSSITVLGISRMLCSLNVSEVPYNEETSFYLLSGGYYHPVCVTYYSRIEPKESGFHLV